MNLIDGWIKKIRNRNLKEEPEGELYDYCPRCYATLILQKGYDPSLPYWVCKGCGEMLINPEIESDVVWFCDECGAILSTQSGFNVSVGEWKCTECGFVNKIDPSELYLSEDEFQATKNNPYRGLSDDDALALSLYREEEYVGGREDVILVRNRETGKCYIKKLLTTYDKSIYEYLKSHPILHMPRIIELYESSNCLIVIEECVAGKTVEEFLENGPMSENQAIKVAKAVCVILDALHNLSTPIVHRDIKPSNIIITHEDEVFLLDMNVAKWYDPEKTDDTRYMGTQYYAAPEQVGYGLSASSAKSDIYAVGMLLNVMVTGCFPKEKRASGDVWTIIEKCISLEADERYTAKELVDTLDELTDA